MRNVAASIIFALMISFPIHSSERRVIQPYYSAQQHCHDLQRLLSYLKYDEICTNSTAHIATNLKISSYNSFLNETLKTSSPEQFLNFAVPFVHKITASCGPLKVLDDKEFFFRTTLMNINYKRIRALKRLHNEKRLANQRQMSWARL